MMRFGMPNVLGVKLVDKKTGNVLAKLNFQEKIESLEIVFDDAYDEDQAKKWEESKDA